MVLLAHYQCIPDVTPGCYSLNNSNALNYRWKLLKSGAWVDCSKRVGKILVFAPCFSSYYARSLMLYTTEFGRLLYSKKKSQFIVTKPLV